MQNLLAIVAAIICLMGIPAHAANDKARAAQDGKELLVLMLLFVGCYRYSGHDDYRGIWLGLAGVYRDAGGVQVEAGVMAG